MMLNNDRAKMSAYMRAKEGCPIAAGAQGFSEAHTRLQAWKATRYCNRCFQPHPNPPSARLCIECERDLRA